VVVQKLPEDVKKCLAVNSILSGHK